MEVREGGPLSQIMTSYSGATGMRGRGGATVVDSRLSEGPGGAGADSEDRTEGEYELRMGRLDDPRLVPRTPPTAPGSRHVGVAWEGAAGEAAGLRGVTRRTTPRDTATVDGGLAEEGFEGYVMEEDERGNLRYTRYSGSRDVGGFLSDATESRSQAPVAASSVRRSPGRGSRVVTARLPPPLSRSVSKRVHDPIGQDRGNLSPGYNPTGWIDKHSEQYMYDRPMDETYSDRGAYRVDLNLDVGGRRECEGRDRDGEDRVGGSGRSAGEVVDVASSEMAHPRGLSRYASLRDAAKLATEYENLSAAMLNLAAEHEDKWRGWRAPASGAYTSNAADPRKSYV